LADDEGAGNHENTYRESTTHDLRVGKGSTKQATVSSADSRTSSERKALYSSPKVESPTVDGLTANFGIGVLETPKSDDASGTHAIGGKLKTFDLNFNLKTALGDLGFSGDGPSAYGLAGFSLKDIFGGNGGGLELGIGAYFASATISIDNILGTSLSADFGFGGGFGGQVKDMPDEFSVDIKLFPFSFGIRKGK
jgi:hypothetical protein